MMENRYDNYGNYGNVQDSAGDGTMNERGEYHYSYQSPPPQKPKKKGPPSWLRMIGLGLILGVVAAVAFIGTNYVADRLFGGEETQEIASNDSESISDVGEANVAASESDSSSTASDVSTIAENTMPSVVSITNMSVSEVQSFFGGYQEQESTSMGSGIIIAQNETELLIVTNNHVVEGNDTLTVTFIDESSAPANVKGTDAVMDVAVVAVELDDISSETKSAISLAQLGDSTQLKVGETAIAIGNALGYGQSVTSGIISALNRTISGYDGQLIQTDAAINPGNSGGALLNAKGEVIGINVAKVASGEVEGMGYAIPISNASEVINKLMNQETRTKVSESERGMLGIYGYDVDSDSASLYHMPAGAYVSEVISGSGADKAGIKQGDIITEFDGRTIDSMSTLQEQISYYRAGETVSVTVEVPNGDEYETQTLEVTLGKNS